MAVDLEPAAHEFITPCHDTPLGYHGCWPKALWLWERDNPLLTPSLCATRDREMCENWTWDANEVVVLIHKKYQLGINMTHSSWTWTIIVNRHEFSTKSSKIKVDLSTGSLILRCETNVDSIAGSEDAGMLLNIILTGRIGWWWVVRHDIPKNDLTSSHFLVSGPVQGCGARGPCSP